MPNFTNLGLVAYCEAMLEYRSPYWYGTFGNIASEELYREKLRQYRDQYEKWSKYSFETQYGLKVHDCIGLIKGYLMNPTLKEDGYVKDPLAPSKYNDKYDWSANMLEMKATEKGSIKSIPEIPGIIVWKSGHVGVYIGNGWVIEERGHSYGTVKTKLSDRPWEEWLKHPSITYITNAKPEPTLNFCTINLPVLGIGIKDKSVGKLQILLNGLGYRDKNGNELKVDNDFGNNTYYAVTCFQKDKYPACGEADGVVGTATWTTLMS